MHAFRRRKGRPFCPLAAALLVVLAAGDAAARFDAGEPAYRVEDPARVLGE